MITQAANYKRMRDKIQDAMFELDAVMTETHFDYAETDIRDSVYKAYVHLSHAQVFIAPWLNKEDD